VFHSLEQIRDAFVEFLLESSEGGYFEAKEYSCIDTGDAIEIRRLIRQLWNCRDIMQSEICECLKLRQGSTYAKGARRLQRIRKAGMWPE